MTTKAALLKTVRLQCEECMVSIVARKQEFDQTARNLVVGCSAPECSLYPFRLGKDPWPKRKGDSDRFKKAELQPPVRRRKAKISTIVSK